MRKKLEKIVIQIKKFFYFEDYLETNKKNKILKKSNNFQDRIYLLFFFLFLLDINFFNENNSRFVK